MWAILLTSCWRENKGDNKREYYLKAIKQWLELTSLPIFIVESSDYTFPEFAGTRLKVCSFNLTDLASSSQYEARSILYALNYFKEDLKPYTHVLKVTARYYVEVESLINKYNQDIILQLACDKKKQWNNSEIFGFKLGLQQDLLMPIYDLGYMENRIYVYALTHNNGRLPPLKNINMAKRGGDGALLKFL